MTTHILLMLIAFISLFRHLSPEGIEQCTGENHKKDDKIIETAKDVGLP